MSLIEELKRLKNEAYEFPKTDYNDGWISAIETVEEIVEEDGDKYRWHDLRKNPEDLPVAKHCDYLQCIIKRRIGDELMTEYSEFGFVEGFGYFFLGIPQNEVIAWRERNRTF